MLNSVRFSLISITSVWPQWQKGGYTYPRVLELSQCKKHRLGRMDLKKTWWVMGVCGCAVLARQILAVRSWDSPVSSGEGRIAFFIFWDYLLVITIFVLSRDHRSSFCPVQESLLVLWLHSHVHLLLLFCFYVVVFYCLAVLLWVWFIDLVFFFDVNIKYFI